MAKLITVTKIGYYDQNGSFFSSASESIRVYDENISSIETHSSGSELMFREPQKLDGGVVTGFLVSQTPAQIQTLLDAVAATAIAASAGTVGAPSISFSDDPDSGMYRIGANNLGVAANGAKVLDIATTGLGVTGALTSTTSITATTTVNGAGINSTGINKSAGTPQTLTGAGAVNVTTHTTLLVTTAADALTLADGAEGQHKFIAMKTDGGDGTLTPTNLRGGSTITFAAVGDTASLFFVDGEWHVVALNGAVLA